MKYKNINKNYTSKMPFLMDETKKPISTVVLVQINGSQLLEQGCPTCSSWA
jgi:hypothetical protein